MTKIEKIELALIPVLGIGTWLLAPLLPARIGIGKLLLWTSALLLLQSLVRDFWLLARQKHNLEPGPLTKARCMCVESTLGATGIVAGIIILGSGVDRLVTMNGWSWGLLVMLVMATGLFIKDFVVEWGPLRFRRDKNHMNIVFTWNKTKTGS
ncbi:MAG: hypothetical protein DRQ59_04655 [Gammaproteobacteria bacterium]|nr:MAG: hypothetical protein DRQ59_04655 [Gammaproteobacteria bacterium]